MRVITIFKLLTLNLLCAAFSPGAFGCQPCLEESSLNLEQSIAQATSIVVGQRVFKDAPIKKGYEWQRDAPQFIEVLASHVLKGTAGKKHLNVRSYSGMCPYNIVVNDTETYVFILSGEGRSSYGAVDRCGVKTLRVTKGAAGAADEVDSGDGKLITRNELQREFIVNPKPVRSAPVAPKKH